MGFTQPNESVVLSQVVAFLGGLASILQLPPPDSPEPPSSYQIVLLFLALALFFAVVWLLLPKKCRARCIGRDRRG
jgi:hypothetical protein